MTETYERAKMSSVFPIDRDAVHRIALNMKEHGYDETQPILLWTDENGETGVLDGWHRYQAALEAGVEPVVEHVDMSRNAALSVISRRNSARRHMSKEQLVAAEIVIARAQGHGVTLADMKGRISAADSTINSLLTAPSEDLEKFVNKELDRDDIRTGKDQKTTSQRRAKKQSRPEQIKLLKVQTSRIASINAVLNEKPSDLNRRIVDAGIEVMEVERDKVLAAAK